MKRAAVQLTASFLVTLIIAIVVFGFGVYIAKEIFSKVSDTQEQLTKQQEEEILQLLTDPTQKVAIPRSAFELKQGKTALVGVGIANRNGNTDNIFTINVIGMTGVRNDLPFCSSDGSYGEVCNEKEWTFDEMRVSIPNNERKAASMLFSVPSGTESGAYVFTIQVKRDGTQYGSLQKVWITVP